MPEIPMGSGRHVAYQERLSPLTAQLSPSQQTRQLLLVKCAQNGASKNFSTKGKNTSPKPEIVKHRPHGDDYLPNKDVKPKKEEIHPKQQELSTPLKNLPLSSRLKTALEKAGYVYVGDVASTQGKIVGVGPKLEPELRAVVGSINVGLSESIGLWKRPVLKKEHKFLNK